MPFSEATNVVSYHGNDLPKIDKNTRDRLPTTAQILKLNGGNGGTLGEKSFKPQIVFALGEVTGGGDAQTTNSINTYEFGSENDSGFAIKINQDSNNKSEVSIGYINSTEGINIYSSSNNLKFTKLISGSVESATSYSNGNTIKDFTVNTNGISVIQSFLDSDLDLNKYYLKMDDGNDCSKFLKATISDSASVDTATKETLTDLLNVYVIETDVNDNYLSYMTASKTFKKGSTATINIETGKSFSTAIGEFVRIQESETKYITGIITSYNNGTGVLSIKNISMQTQAEITEITLAIGSFVTMNDVWSGEDKHCISITSSPYINSPYASDNDLYKNLFGSTNNAGFRFSYKKEKTNLIPESKNAIRWGSDNFFVMGTPTNGQAIIKESEASNTFNINRIGNRDYIKSQYSGGKSVLITKNKFSIMFNGFYSNNKSYKYINGYYGGLATTSDMQQIMLDNTNVQILIGNGAKANDNSTYSPYFTMKLYEVLVYKNIVGLSTGRPQRIICDYLVSKYKNKAFFDKSEIQTDAPIYYSQSDRPNILGKVQKIIS